ncbi:hypothetical protein QWY31_07870 [Cytophagales bacterium LB-30]|uniref:Outer membrane lipoprotein-sorting protein n=1 Tax=Shiella aurantiaca TaxID=3058365 RepID=A0ABT8F582_9BACT|nr:hypothetical protein [Shiella aurantiaca]MDN4165414.1 hypothetical protein [Shiella aurantiaca]
MKFSYIFKCLCLLSIFWMSSGFIQGPHQLVQMHMLKRTATNGYTTSMEADLYYSSEGKMVTLMQAPYKTLVSNTSKGELTIYNFDQNSVISENNYLYSTESNQLYYFLSNKKADMGLSSSGFVLKETVFEDGVKITRWTPPMQIAKQLGTVELVHDKANPIFMSYSLPSGQIIKKVYFYSYIDLKGVDFPTAVTEISYRSEKDSVLTKTTYNNFTFNEEVDQQYLNFKIPANAKVLTNPVK